MTHTIRTARWGNQDKSSAVVVTDECGAVAISEVDTPDEWTAFLAWEKANAVEEPLPPKQPLTRAQLVERKLGVSVEELKSMLAGETR
jgi:hypothetical protein